MQARSGRNSEAVGSLKTAIIGARTETADADFAIADRLESWHILDDAVAFANRGANRLGAGLFKDAGATLIYSRIMVRARRMNAVLARLVADPGMDLQVAQAVGRIIDETYTPEDKTQLEQALNTRSAALGQKARDASLLPLVQSAGLADLESRWRYESMSAQAQQVDERLVALQSQCGAYGELGRQLEQYAAKNAGRPVEAAALNQAAQAFIAEGDMESQLRVMRSALARNGLSGNLQDRYLTQMASRQPQELVSIVRNNGSADLRNRAIQLAIDGDHQELSYSAIRTRGITLAPVWTKAYSALAGEYFNDRSPAIGTAFQSALDTRTIGERLKTPLKPDTVIVGSVWFYYGARYGDYLESGGSADAGAWLPASLEAAPGNPDVYMALGDSEAADKAIVQFEHALELDPDRGDAEDHIARVLWTQGRRTDAIAHWKLALATFLRIQSRGVRVPDSFWNRAAETFTAIGERHALGELRADIANLLGDYYQRNNEYRLNELIEPAARASIASGEGTEWLVELAQSMDDPEMVIDTLMRLPEMSDSQKLSLERDLVAARAKRAKGLFGDELQNAEASVTQARWQLVAMLLDAGDVKGASAERSQIAPEQSRNFEASIEIRLASRTATLDALLERYRSSPDAPSAEMLQRAAVNLRGQGEEESARKVLEFLYDREIRSGRLGAANFLGLAEVKLERKDLTTALALLNRMALVVEDGFDTLLPAAELFNKYGETPQAADFIRRRVTAVPWDADAKVQLASTLSAGSAERERLLSAVVTDGQAQYKLRAEAARLASPQSLAGVAGTELALLSSANIPPSAAEKPYQMEARIYAARQVVDPEVKLRLWREALAIAPSDSRVMLGALQSALALRRDNLALAFAQSSSGSGQQAEIAESLAAAAERIDDLQTAQNYLRSAINLRPQDQREALTAKLNALTAELDRRAKNAARQPVIKNVIEQDQMVRARIPRSAQ